MALITDIHWYPQTRIALFTVEHTIGENQSRTLMQVNTSTGVVTRLADMTPSQSLFVSSRIPMAFVYTEATNKAAAKITQSENGQLDDVSTIRFYSPQGTRPAIRLSEEIGVPNWMPDDKSLYAVKRSVAMVDGKRTIQKQYSLLDLKTGQITHPDKLPLLSNQEEIAPDKKNVLEDRKNWQIAFATEDAMVSKGNGKPESLPALWIRPSITEETSRVTDSTPIAKSLASNAPVPFSANDMLTTDSLLVATNAEEAGFLLGKNTAALLFIREGVLCAAPIFRMPSDDFARRMRTVQRTVTMSNAKQIGLGIFMYSQDYDGNLPQPGSAVSNVSHSLYPYIKNKNTFTNPTSGEFGFTYSYKGNTSLSSIEKPETTPLGYLSGAGGHAVIWGDGHVTWEDNP